MGDVNSREFAAHVFSGIIGATATLALAALVWPSPVQATVPAIPSQLDLGGVQWKVEVVEYPGDSEGVLGFTHCDIHHIQLKKGVADLRETLVHEILHGYVCGNGLQDFVPANLYYNSSTVEKHDGVDNIGFVVTDAMERNPRLAAYLSQETK